MDDENSEANFRAKYEARVKSTTLDELPALMQEMLAEQHDYGTICLAIAFAGAAAAWAFEKSPKGGITGFQAGCIGWELLRQWGTPSLGETGTRIVNYDDLLFPQYADKFTTISAETFERVQAKAQLNLENGTAAHPAVVAHWQSLAAGTAPFGLRIAA